MGLVRHSLDLYSDIYRYFLVIVSRLNHSKTWVQLQHGLVTCHRVPVVFSALLMSSRLRVFKIKLEFTPR